MSTGADTCQVRGIGMNTSTLNQGWSRAVSNHRLFSNLYPILMQPQVLHCALGRIRTDNHEFRRLLLFPTELQGLTSLIPSNFS